MDGFASCKQNWPPNPNRNLQVFKVTIIKNRGFQFQFFIIGCPKFNKPVLHDRKSLKPQAVDGARLSPPPSWTSTVIIIPLHFTHTT